MIDWFFSGRARLLLGGSPPDTLSLGQPIRVVLCDYVVHSVNQVVTLRLGMPGFLPVKHHVQRDIIRNIVYPIISPGGLVLKVGQYQHIRVIS
jgi:hypothetical protein